MTEGTRPAPKAQDPDSKTIAATEDGDRVRLYTVPDIQTALKHLGLFDPKSAVLMKNAASKYKAGEDGTASSEAMDSLLNQHAKCAKRLSRLVREYGALISSWHEKSKPLSRRAVELILDDVDNHLHLPGVECKQCGRLIRTNKKEVRENDLTDEMMAQIPRDVYDSAMGEYLKLCAKEKEVRAAYEAGRLMESMLERTQSLMKLELRMLSAKRKCFEAQELLDSYPDAIELAEKSLMDIPQQLIFCITYNDFRCECAEISLKLERAREAVQKIERHGRVAGNGEVLELEAKLEATEAKTEAQKLMIYEATGMHGKRVGDIQCALQARQRSAQDLVKNYDKLMDKGLADLTKRIDTAAGLEAEFVIAKNEFDSDLRAAGIQVTA